MIEGWSLKRFISIGFALMLCAMACVCGLSVERMGHVLSVQREHSLGLLPAARLANDFQREMLNARISLIYFVTIQKAGSRELGSEHLENAQSTLVKLNQLISARAELSDLRPLAGRLDTELADYRSVLTTTLDMVQGGTVSGDRYTAQVKAWAARGAVLVADADRMQALSSHMSEDRNQENISSLRLTALVCAWLFAASLVFSVALAAWLVNRLNQNLRAIATALDESAEQIAHSSREIVSSSQAMAQNASEQAATIEETSSASTEINSMARRTTENSATTAGIVTSAQAGCELTNDSLAEMVGAMQAIHSSSLEVTKIVKVIDGIAFQTNILALNAAVEAARAGQAGQGFAVVADEVRSLAQRCASAAKDTTELVSESMERSTRGADKMKQVVQNMQTVTLESARIRELVEEINTGSREQSRGVDQIDKAISEMEQVTQSSAAQAEQGAAAASELSSQADMMSQLVVRLKVLVEGGVAVH